MRRDDNIDDMKSWKGKQRKKKLKRNLADFINNSEKAIYKSKKLMVVVIIPALEVLINLMVLLNDDDYEDHDTHNSGWY